MIYDCFTFYNEIDLLLLRLKLLNDKVDKFVISEASLTHSGIYKPFNIENNWEKFSDFHKKIIYIKISNFPNYVNSWTYENYQRNKLMEGLAGCKDEDIILLSDIDEIPNPDKILKKIRDGVIYCYLQEMYFYYANNFKSNHIIWEGGTKSLTFRTLKNGLINEKYVIYNTDSFPKNINTGTTLTKIRLYRNLRYINNGGWHLSYLGGVQAIKSKIEATSHQEINIPKINNEQHIMDCLNKGIDILDVNSKCYTRDLRYLPDYFKDVLPRNFIILNYRNLNSIFYKLLKTFELISIYTRGYVRKILG